MGTSQSRVNSDERLLGSDRLQIPHVIHLGLLAECLHAIIAGDFGVRGGDFEAWDATVLCRQHADALHAFDFLQRSLHMPAACAAHHASDLAFVTINRISGMRDADEEQDGDEEVFHKVVKFRMKDHRAGAAHHA